jgi:2-methylaconitate cis-trans-isomerase PrpF
MPESATGRRTRRSPRYQVVAPVRYRATDGTDWLDASTVNMSDRGLLVRTRHPAPAISVAVEVRVSLAVGGSLGSDVACCGRVVWQEVLPTGDVVVGMTIDTYQFEKRRLVPPCSGSRPPDEAAPSEEDVLTTTPSRRQRS